MSDPDAMSDRLNSLTALTTALDRRAEQDPDFKRAIGTLPADVQAIHTALEKDPDLWRLNRPFHAVHVPSLLAVVAMLEDVDDMTSVTGEDRDQINQAIHRASQLASSARHRIERSAFDAAKLELDVLAKYAPPPDTPLQKPTTLEKTVEGVKAASLQSIGSVTRSAAALPGFLGRSKDRLSLSWDQATAVPQLATNLLKSVSGTVSDTVAKPIEMRIKASGTALSYGVSTGVGLGVVTAVLFPPLLPLSAGGAVLAAMRGWKTEMEATRALNAKDRERRIAELKAERRAALQQLANGAPSFQMETDEINLTVDVETGEADAVVLKGPHTGRNWSDLDPMEKAQVVNILSATAEGIVSILQWGADNL